MEKDFSELIEYLDGRFNGIEKRFNSLPEVFITKDEAVTKNDLEDLRSDIRNLQKSIDNNAIKADKYFQEMVMLSHKVDRHEKWLLQIADKMGIKLEY